MPKLLLTALAIAIAGFISLSGTAADARQIATGKFVGASDHITTGSVQIVKNDDGSHTVILSENFSLDGAPDPRVGFGKDGNFDVATDSGLLGSLNGEQSFTVPAGVDPAAYNEVYIWCLKFNVPLGVAALN